MVGKTEEGRGEGNGLRGAAAAAGEGRVRGGNTKKFICPVIGGKISPLFFLLSFYSAPPTPRLTTTRLPSVFFDLYLPGDSSDTTESK